MSDEFSNRLADLWQQGGRDLAVGFLRRATSIDNNLQEILAALQFEGVVEHLGDIKLREIFTQLQSERAARPPASAAGDMSASPKLQIAAAKKPRRNRRTSEEMQQMRQLLHDALNDEPGSLNTVQLVQVLEDEKHKVDTIIVNTLLKALELEGRITNLGGKPKAWRAVRAPRAANTPMFIRRTQEPTV